MKKITIVSNTRGTGKVMKSHLLEYFHDCVYIENILLNELSDYFLDSTDLILASGNYENIKEKLQKYNLKRIPTIFAERFIDYDKIADLSFIPDNTTVLLVNDSKSTAYETVAQLKTIGFDKINFDLYYPKKTSYSLHDIVITPGESGYIPYSPKRVVDIGSRKVSISTLIEIIRTLDLPLTKNKLIMDSFLKDIVKLNRELLFEQTKTKLLNDALVQVVEKIDYGVAYINQFSQIVFCNNKFAYYFGMKKMDLLNKDIESLISYDKLENLNNMQVETVLPIGKVIIKKDYTLDNSGYILTLQVVNMKVTSSKILYTFRDYITENSTELTMISNAKKFSRSESCILIQGESGTGKEILAQAIHNNSARKDKPFIPINITTISNSLIESELFGYEKGSFTGGLKEGKSGIFELANGGTIFIDEIGDAPANIQAQLLRVLEENTIRRVGSHEEIPIDVRIIAATNKNLLKETEIGNFRLDLFFRLNILPLHTMPLREKIDDVVVLLKYFLNKKTNLAAIDDYFENSTIEFLNSYAWPGNIRELSNLVDYLSIIDLKRKIKIDDLQLHMLDARDINYNIKLALREDEIEVLKLYKKQLKVLGRVKASRLLQEQNVDITEGMLKRILDSLHSKDLLHYVKNKGFIITNKGKSIL